MDLKVEVEQQPSIHSDAPEWADLQVRYSVLSLCRYGMDRHDGQGLAQLLRELGHIEGLAWIRILYAYPSYFTDELIDEIATNPKVVM